MTHVTNGVHTPAWDSVEADHLWEVSCGKERWRGTMSSLERDFRCVSDSRFWQLRSDARKSLVDYVRKQHVRQLASPGAFREDLAQAAQALDTNALTLGFARRFASYKRPNLLLHDPQRFARILTNRDRPVQLVLARRAHPQDVEGQNMIRQWIDFAHRPEVRSRVVFLSDYDVLMAEHLVQGVDVWVNTPRRPWKASGTSGMRVLVNGGLNLSELDGWWAEAYSPEVGWAIGDGQEHSDDPSWDAAGTEALYGLLEREVVPEFYTRNEIGIPVGWVARMRESMARLTPSFSTNRVVRQYTEEHYLLAAANYSARAASHGRLGLDLLNWQEALSKLWSALRFGSAALDQEGEQYFFQVQVNLDEFDPEAVKVELYAEGQNGAAPIREPTKRDERLVGSANGFTYTVRVFATSLGADYTPRLIPHHRGASVPLEASFVLWHDSAAWRRSS
ncbi:MAG: alpha-glucan family phosphorylase [Candidatus Acidiferrum sp.]